MTRDEARTLLGGAGTQNLITESGLYKLAMRSDKPEAKRFLTNLNQTEVSSRVSGEMKRGFNR